MVENYREAVFRLSLFRSFEEEASFKTEYSKASLTGLLFRKGPRDNCFANTSYIIIG